MKRVLLLIGLPIVLLVGLDPYSMNAKSKNALNKQKTSEKGSEDICIDVFIVPINGNFFINKFEYK